MTSKYKTRREAYDHYKSMDLAEDTQLHLDIAWRSSPFMGAYVSGVIQYNNLTSSRNDPPGSVPVFLAIFPLMTRKEYDGLCKTAKKTFSDDINLARTRAAISAISSYSMTMLFNDADLNTHPLIPKLVADALESTALYTGGDITHCENNVVSAEDIDRTLTDYVSKNTYVNESNLTIHPSQIRPGYDDLLKKQSDARSRQVLECGLTRSELARNGLGSPDFF